MSLSSMATLVNGALFLACQKLYGLLKMQKGFDSFTNVTRILVKYQIQIGERVVLVVHYQ